MTSDDRRPAAGCGGTTGTYASFGSTQVLLGRLGVDEPASSSAGFGSVTSETTTLSAMSTTNARRRGEERRALAGRAGSRPG